MRLLANRMCPTPDGALLATDVYLPDGPGPYPVILQRTPYNKTSALAIARRFVAQGYVVVAQDCRGRWESTGEREPFYETADGATALDWVARQAWCNGRIGLCGASYNALVQYAASGSAHPALRCFSPRAIMGDFFAHYARPGGPFALGSTLVWSLNNSSARTTPMVTAEWPRIMAQRTFADLFELVGQEWSFIREMVEHDTLDAFWERRDLTRLLPKITVPSMHTDGWFDYCNNGSSSMYTQLRRQGATALARDHQRLIIGPWGHGNISVSYGGVDFPASTGLDVVDQDLRWFNLWLKDLDDGITGESPVRLFIMGANEWADFSDWPVPGTRAETWYLDAEGAAIGHGSCGRLASSAAAGEACTGYRYDPADPVPLRGGPIPLNLAPEAAGMVDVRESLDRADVLYYRGPAFDRACTLIGEAVLDLWVQTDSLDIDMVARLCVVEPMSGRVLCLSLGQCRAAYREGYDRLVPLTPGEPARLRIVFYPLAYRFAPGSQLALLITSSDYPRLYPNPTTMERPYSALPPQAAEVRVLHSRDYPTSLTLPMLD